MMFQKNNNKFLKNAYRFSIIITTIGAVILLVSILGFGFENNELVDFGFIGGIIVVIGLAGIPLIIWFWMIKKQKIF
ncbi:hypothetical protein KJN74_03575 [Candidatus Bathyarchaeota archaeon]|nr:hypothetical protein [Candidatus Bathyarchaeota archaeon]